jgi:GGDEF domain-containing protein
MGDQLGDAVPRMGADRSKEACRPSDVVARYDSRDEMVAILPDTDQPVAAMVAE